MPLRARSPRSRAPAVRPRARSRARSRRPRTGAARAGSPPRARQAPARAHRRRARRSRGSAARDERPCSRARAYEEDAARDAQFENRPAAVLTARWLDGPVAQPRGATRGERPELSRGTTSLLRLSTRERRWERVPRRSEKEETMRRILLVVVGFVAALVAATLAVTAAAPAAGPPRYLDPHAPIKDRVGDLLDRMTLAEKVGQMDQIVIGKLRDTNSPANGDCNNAAGNNDPLQTKCLQRVLIDYNTGSILSGGTDNPADNTGHGWAEQYNTIQHYAIDHSRLHIPVIYGVDAVHGFGHPYEATLFPQSIGMGATWDTDLAQAAGAATRQQLLATGGNWDFAPVQDLARDNRWGRYYETWAEEPELAGALGGANIRGLQGGGFDSPQVAATVKHFAGYSESINGHDRVEAQLPIRYLQDIFLPAYA